METQIDWKRPTGTTCQACGGPIWETVQRFLGVDAPGGMIERDEKVCRTCGAEA